MTNTDGLSKIEKAALDSRTKELTVWARGNLNLEQAIGLFAVNMATVEFLMKMNEDSISSNRQTIAMLQAISSDQVNAAPVLHDAAAFLLAVPELLKKAVSTGLQISKRQATKRGSRAANIRHSNPGESREKRLAIQAAWQSGKYASRVICAEQECAGLMMSFSTARKALINVLKRSSPLQCTGKPLRCTRHSRPTS